ATGAPVAEVALGGSEEVDRAVQAAQAAQVSWAALAPAERGRRLTAISRVVRASRDEFFDLEIAETAKFRPIMEGEFESGAGAFEYYGGIIRAFFGEAIDLGPAQQAYTRHEPYSVVGIITPWNCPLAQAARDIAPALAVGSAVVVKPSEFTSSTTVLLAKLATEAGLPEGLLNVVTGTGPEVGAAIVAHEGVRRLIFTGSLATGRAVAQGAAARGIPATLELGGKSPNVVFADADLDAVARDAVPAFTRNCGQGCACLTRLIVDRRVHDDLVARVLELVSAVTPGEKLGPLTTDAQLAKVLSYFEVAAQDGATLAAGGRAASDEALAGGRYVEPTVYTDVTPAMRIFREEVFGPVLCVTAFDNEEEAIALANDTDYGLVASLWTQDVGRVHRVAARIDAGQVLVNGAKSNQDLPFGGFKGSGYGRAKGFEALRDCTQVKTVVVATPGA
ncbi:MAG TPA: aldehyde dehydrogenase family protein, partial [Acidimicrobiales bacterium]